MFDFPFFKDENYEPDPNRDDRSLVEMYQQASPILWDRGAGAQVLEYLTGVVGLSYADVSHNDWRVSEPPFACRLPFWHLLVPSRGADRELLAVRGMLLKDGYHLNIRDHVREGSPYHGGAVAVAPGQAFTADDVPSPFEPGLFDDEVVWAFHDPAAALLVNGAGLTATALFEPHRTLGSVDGLYNLLSSGLLTRRDRPRGTLVVADPEGWLTPSGSRLIRGFYEEVIEAPALTGPDLFQLVRGLRDALDAPNDIEREMLRHVREHGRRCTSLPKRLPPRPKSPDAPAPLVPIKSLSASELETTGPGGVEWLVEDLVALDAVTLLQGQPKAGKTTFSLSMAVAVVTGREFLARPCTAAPVVLVTEQNVTTIRASLRGALPEGMALEDLPERGLSVITMDQLYGRPWPEVVGYVKEECARLGARLAIFDTLIRVAGVVGDAENSAGAAGDLFRPLKELASSGVAVLAIQHSRKSEGAIAETGRGSNAHAGEADHLLRLRNARGGSSLRRLDSVGRLGASVDLVVERTADGTWARGKTQEEATSSGAMRSKKVEQLRVAAVRVLTAASEREVTVKEVLASVAKLVGMAVSRFSADKVLKALVDDGIATVSGRGTKNDPLRYRLRLLPSPPLGGDE